MSSPRRSGGGDAARGPTRVRLRYRGHDLFLSPGQYVVGRSSTCHIVIEHALVSRRHAQIVVVADGVTIQDLGSINGVLVNGTRLAEGVVPLADGDRILIGNEELELRLEALDSEVRAPDTGLRRTRPTMSGDDPVVPAEAPLSIDSEHSTKRVNALDLIGLVADKALSGGRVREAEEMLRMHLNGVLDDLHAGRTVASETPAVATMYALKLARATAAGRWFDYVVDLLSAQQMPLPEALAEELQVTLGKVAVVDVARLERYAALVKALPASFEKLRAARRIDELLKAAAERRR